MQNEILQKIHIRLSKVILLLDAFTEEAVTNGVRVRVPHGGRKPVIKPGGYCLFLDMGQDEFEIEMESPIYQRRRLRLKPDGGRDVEEVFLYPSAAYPVKSGAVMVQGTAWPGTVLLFHLEEGMPEGRLIHDCKKGDTEIMIFMRDMSGNRRKWYIRDKEKQTGEYVRIREFSEESQRYCVRQPLQADYRKKNTAVYQAYECMADENGEFCLLLRHLKEQNYILYSSCVKDGKEFCKKTEIEGRKRIQL